jgi:TatD DNase family protein
MFIDTHCHLTFAEFDPDRAMVIGNAKKAGVKKFICPGVDLFSSSHVVTLAEKNPGVIFAAIGYHPYEAQHNPPVKELEQLIQVHKDSIVAVGETGLDYHQYKGEDAAGKKQNQKIMFEEQLQLALKYNLPVIMHTRDAFEDFFAVLDNLPAMPRGVIHCFSGGLQEIRFAQSHNLFIGIDGNVTYSKQLQSVVPSIPLSMLLLETDSPYLTPIPH